MKSKSTVMSRKELATVRRLTLLMGGDSPGAQVAGLLLAVAIASAMSGLVLLVWLSGGPPIQVYGAVTGFGVAETDYGSMPLARVWVDDREVIVPMGRTNTCLLGERIRLYRRRALLGYRYRPALPRPCG